tara:strand:- start:729 stop:992 length:264 start_codon:yes stop_codon:yes gene_type:complete
VVVFTLAKEVQKSGEKDKSIINQLKSRVMGIDRAKWLTEWAYDEGKISRAEMLRYQELYKKLIGEDLFVEIGDSQEWKEFQKLQQKL